MRKQNWTRTDNPAPELSGGGVVFCARGGYYRKMNRQNRVILAVVTALFFGTAGTFFFLRTDRDRSREAENVQTPIALDLFKPVLQGEDNGEEMPLVADRTKEPFMPDLDRPLIIKHSLNEEILQRVTADIANIVAALKENSNQFDLWTQLASSRKLIGDYLGARDALDFANRLGPKNSVGYSMLANLYWSELKDYSKAEKNFLKVIENDPSDTGAYRNLSDLYRYSYTQKADQADDILLTGLLNNPNHRDLISYLAAYYRDTGNTAEARKYLEKLLTMTTELQMRLQIQSDLNKL